MNKLTIILFFLAGSFWSCDEDKIGNVSCDNGVFATIRDIAGLDGCGFVFELSDGTRLVPMRLMFCGTPPLPKEVTEDPLYKFQFVEGKQVRIEYKEIKDAVGICMVGKKVKITCIEEIELTKNL